VETVMSVRRDHVPVVLLVEASLDDRTLYADYLRAQHYRVITAFDTSAALRQAINADIIVTGIQVPGPFDGVELVQRLRANGGARLAVLSTGATRTDRTRAIQAGCDLFVEKPCSPDQLLRFIRRVRALQDTGDGQAREGESPGDSRDRAGTPVPPRRRRTPAHTRTKSHKS
jgi:two-component system, cell cycle response regulator DivK